MKKPILLFAMFTFMVISAIAQMSNSDIARIINSSKEANELRAGVKDPDLIQPGQTLTFLFEDGSEHSLTVEAGDNQWKIVRSKLAALEAKYGTVIPPSDLSDDGSTVNPPLALKESNTDTWQYGILAALFVGCLIFAMWFFSQKRKKTETERLQNPVTAGPPVVPNGITNEQQATRHAHTIAESVYGTNYNLREVQSGYLHGENVEVTYGDNTHQTHTFRNQVGYRGIVDLPQSGGETTQEMIYFLQGCGNDVRVGRFMRSNAALSFTLQPISENARVADVAEAPISVLQPTEHASLNSNTMEMKVDLNAIVKTLTGSGQKFRLGVTELELTIEAEGTPQLLLSGNHTEKREVVESDKN